MDSSDPRLFIALKISLSNNLRNAIVSVKELVQDSAMKWVDEKQLHVTLHFLGNTPRYKIGEIQLALQKVAALTTNFSIEITTAGYFGKPNPLVVWMGIEKCPSLNNLQGMIGDELRRIGLKTDSKAYKPHITLGRVKQYKESDNLPNQLKSISFSVETELVNSFFLIESRLTASGAQYIELASFELK